MSAYVYRVTNSDGVLLYIGSSLDVRGRLLMHRKIAPWWCEGLRVTVQGFDSLAEARQAEAYAIVTEHPRWNIHFRAADHPDGPANSGYAVAKKFPGEWRNTPSFDMARHERWGNPDRRVRTYRLDDSGTVVPVPFHDDLPEVERVKAGNAA